MKRLLQLIGSLTLLLCVTAISQAQVTVSVGALGSAVTTTDAQAAPPAGTQVNDVAFIYAWTRDTTDTTTITGYTEVAQVDTSTGSHRLFWKRLAGASGTETCDHNTSADNYCQMFVYRGVVLTGNPWDAIGTFTTSGTEPIALTGITSSANGAMIAMFGGYEDNDTASFVQTSTDPTTYVNQYAETTTGADGAILNGYGIRATAGATGTVTVDFNTALSQQFAGILLSVTLQPIGSTTSTFVRKGTVCTTVGISTTCAFTSNTSGNSIIFVGRTLLATTPSITDTAGNTYTLVVNSVCASVGDTFFVLEADNIAASAGTNTLTIAGLLAGNTDGQPFEFSGVAASAFDKSACTHIGAQTNPSSGSTALTSFNNELVITFMSSNVGTITMTDGSTNISTDPGNLFDTYNSRNVTGTGYFASTGRAASQTVLAGVVTFKMTNQGSGGPNGGVFIPGP